MKAKLTANTIKKLEIEPKPYEVVDTELKGFLLRVQPTGRKTFYYSYRTENGNRKRIKIGTLGPELTIQQARDSATSNAAKVIAGEDIQAEKQKAKRNAIDLKDKTLSRFLDAHYQPWVVLNLKSGQSSIDRIMYSFPELLGVPLTDINVAYIEKWRSNKLKRNLKPSTINRCVHSLSAVLTKAVEWDVIHEHPLRRLKSLPLDNSPKVRYLSNAEDARLYQALVDRDTELKESRSRGNEHRKSRSYDLLPELSGYSYGDRMTPLIILSLKTGMRRGELFDLEWTNVNFDKKHITVTAETAKSKRTRHIPLSPIALQVLKNWQQQSSDTSGRVFPSDTGVRLDNVRSSWKSILKAADISSFRWHDMRHDFASKLVMKSVPLNTVRELCGHADLNTTLRYAHLAPDHKADAIALIG